MAEWVRPKPDGKGASLANRGTQDRGKNPYWKLAHPDVVEDTIEWIASLVAGRMPKSRIKNCIRAAVFPESKKEDPKLPPSIVEALISEARVFLNTRSSEDMAIQFQRSIAFYEEMISDEDVQPKDRLKAQERLDSLFGFDAKFNKSGDTPERKAEAVMAALASMDEDDIDEPSEEDNGSSGNQDET